MRRWAHRQGLVKCFAAEALALPLACARSGSASRMSNEFNSTPSDATAAPESFQSLREPVPAPENLLFGIIAGTVAMLIGTAIWVGVTVATNFQIGYMAVGVGFLVGIAMRFAGRGTTPLFAGIGAGLSLLGCALGNLFTGCVLISREFEVGFAEVVSNLDMTGVQEIMSAMFSPMDILFYALGAYAGWKYSVIRAE